MAAKNTSGITPHQFKPGQSGNPKGRKKGSMNLKTRLAKWLDVPDKVKLPNGKETSVTVYDSMILGVIKKAREGDPYAFEVLMNRLEGKVADRVVHAGDEDAPVKLEVADELDYSLLDTDTLKKIAAARKKK